MERTHLHWEKRSLRVLLEQFLSRRKRLNYNEVLLLFVRITHVLWYL